MNSAAPSGTACLRALPHLHGNAVCQVALLVQIIKAHVKMQNDCQTGDIAEGPAGPLVVRREVVHVIHRAVRWQELQLENQRVLYERD